MWTSLLEIVYIRDKFVCAFTNTKKFSNFRCRFKSVKHFHINGRKATDTSGKVVVESFGSFRHLLDFSVAFAPILWKNHIFVGHGHTSIHFKHSRTCWEVIVETKASYEYVRASQSISNGTCRTNRSGFFSTGGNRSSGVIFGFRSSLLLPEVYAKFVWAALLLNV